MNFGKLFLLAVCVGVFINSQAQEISQSGFLGFNAAHENAAYTGSRETISTVSTIRQQQYKSLKAPHSTSLLVHSPLKKSKISIGGVFYTTQNWIVTNQKIELLGSYRLDLNTTSNLRFGVNIGLANTKINASQIRTVHLDPLPSMQINITSPLLGVGFLYTREKAKYGLSVPNLAPFSSQFSDQDITSPNNYVIASATNLISIGESAIQLDSRLITGWGNNYTRIIFSPSFVFKNKSWLGVQVRNAQWLGVQAGLHFAKHFDIGYCYEVLNNELAGTTNEFLLRFELNKEENSNRFLF